MKPKFSATEPASFSSHPVYRIWPGRVRSQGAFDSWKDFPVIDIPAVAAQDPRDMRSRERACSQAHATVLRAFLATDASHCIVIEDDVILCDREWLSFTQFDFFLPFINCRRPSLGNNRMILAGVMPEFGNQAAIVSRRFAEAYLPRLASGIIADHANRQIPGMRVGCYASNAIIHDTGTASTICETRRANCSARVPSSKIVRPGNGAARKDAFCRFCNLWFAVANRLGLAQFA